MGGLLLFFLFLQLKKIQCQRRYYNHCYEEHHRPALGWLVFFFKSHASFALFVFVHNKTSEQATWNSLAPQNKPCI